MGCHPKILDFSLGLGNVLSVLPPKCLIRSPLLQIQTAITPCLGDCTCFLSLPAFLYCPLPILSPPDCHAEQTKTKMRRCLSLHGLPIVFKHPFPEGGVCPSPPARGSTLGAHPHPVLRLHSAGLRELAGSSAAVLSP